MYKIFIPLLVLFSMSFNAVSKDVRDEAIINCGKEGSSIKMRQCFRNYLDSKKIAYNESYIDSLESGSDDYCEVEAVYPRKEGCPTN